MTCFFYGAGSLLVSMICLFYDALCRFLFVSSMVQDLCWFLWLASSMVQDLCMVSMICQFYGARSQSVFMICFFYGAGPFVRFYNLFLLWYRQDLCRFLWLVFLLSKTSVDFYNLLILWCRTSDCLDACTSTSYSMQLSSSPLATQSMVTSESIEWFIHNQAFSPSYDLAPPPPPPPFPVRKSCVSPVKVSDLRGGEEPNHTLTRLAWSSIYHSILSGLYALGKGTVY